MFHMGNHDTHRNYNYEGNIFNKELNLQVWKELRIIYRLIDFDDWIIFLTFVYFSLDFLNNNKYE